MKKIIIAIFLVLTIFFASCTNPVIPEPEETTTEQTTTEQTTTEHFAWTEPETWPKRSGFLEEGGHYIGDWDLGRFRPMFYHLPYHFVNLVDQNNFHIWERLRSNEEFHNESVAVAFVRDFNISREDFERANEKWRSFTESRRRSPEDFSQSEIYPVDLIFSFDNERINEFFLWENSIYAHEVGLPNPLRGGDVNGIFTDHPNWTENPGWREHPFWEYLPFNPANAGH